MEWIDSITSWLQQNWGVTLFGTASVGGLITTIIFLVKQWLANKLQGSRYEALFKQQTKRFDELSTMYEAEKEKNANEAAANEMMKQGQAAMMDALIKIALSSKLDSDDKASIVANLENLKNKTPKEIILEAKDKTTTVINNVSEEVTEKPEQTIYNVALNASSLLEKYSNKE